MGRRVPRPTWTFGPLSCLNDVPCCAVIQRWCAFRWCVVCRRLWLRFLPEARA